MKIQFEIQNLNELDAFMDRFVASLSPQRRRAAILKSLTGSMRRMSGKIPEDKGDLKRSLTKAGGKGQHFRVTKHTISFGSRVPQAYWQLYYHRKRRDLNPDPKGLKTARIIALGAGL